MRILGSAGCAPNDDISALDDLRQRHPTHDLPHWSDNVPPPLVVDSTAVMGTLQAFPRGSSHGGSKLRPQHLLDAICGTSSPFAGHCLDQLTYFMNKLLSGKLDRRIGPWLSGAPLTALRKKPSGFRPIAVGEVLRRLASRLCCSAVRPYLPDIFLPYGQVGVGVKGGLEAAVHGLRKLIVDNSQNDELCCAKVDMRNAFNECRRSSFLHRVKDELPQLYAWVQWSYHCAGELRFGSNRIISTAGVQQGDPLGPLLFSLVLMELLDNIGDIPDLKAQLWYLDDGTFIGSRDAVSSLLNSLVEKGPEFGIYVNMSKCEVFWPSGDQDFPTFDSRVRRININSSGSELLGSPIVGTDTFFDEFFKARVDYVLDAQSHLSDLDDPQVEIHLLRSCMSICKLNHLLRTTPPDTVAAQLLRFDEGLRHSLQTILRSSIPDTSWLQATHGWLWTKGSS